MYVNAIHAGPPTDLPQLRALFATAARGMRVTLSASTDALHGGVEGWRYALGDLQANIWQRQTAAAARLLITEEGSHWTDWLLSVRTAARKPSIVLGWRGSAGTGAHDTRSHLLWCGAGRPGETDACASCSAFHRGACVTEYSPGMDNMLCHSVQSRLHKFWC